jgi:tellurite resistance protein TehA-like permease
MEIAHEASDGISAVWLALLAALLVLVSAYAHLQIPRYTAGTARIARILLLAVGVGLGTVSAIIYAESDRSLAFVAFLIGFGVVHVPTAFILLLKRARGAGKS